MFRSTILAVLATAGAVLAQGPALQVLVPGGPNLWWVAQSVNTIAWNCQQTQHSNFTILVANSDPKILVAPLAIVAIENNFDCSKTITVEQANLTPGQGYTVQLADPFNSTNVFAASEPFEVKVVGSAYPDPSSTPTAAASTSASATGSGSTSSPSASGKANSAVATSVKGVTFVGAVLGALALAL